MPLVHGPPPFVATPVARPGPGLGVLTQAGGLNDDLHKFSENTMAIQPDAGEFLQQWMLWQLADSAFPTGGFAHSAGLEAAWQQGEVRDRKELASFLEASLQQLGHASLPFVTAAFDQPARVAEWDGLCDAFTTNHVANRASRSQGRAFLAAVERIYPSGLRSVNESEPLACGHFAPVFGCSLGRLGVSRPTTAGLFFFCQLRGMVTAGVRLNIVGPMEAQILQQHLSPVAGRILQNCANLTPENIAQTAPLLDLWQGAQDRLYSRLFQS